MEKHENLKDASLSAVTRREKMRLAKNFVFVNLTAQMYITIGSYDLT